MLVLLLPGSALATTTSASLHAAIVGNITTIRRRTRPSPLRPQSRRADPASPGQPRPRVADPAERIPARTIVLAPAGTATLDAHGTLVLPKMSIPGVKDQAARTLPQFYINRAGEKRRRRQQFRTPAARSERLLNKYYTPFEQKLNKGLLNPVKSWGARDESIAYSAEQLNDIAYLIELSLAAGIETPEEQKKTREEYYKALADKPR
ncbi:MAG: hypothetical protein WDM96_06825 [Lacunisphaera sp.]